jgi:ketose-bisphosphate aldolase
MPLVTMRNLLTHARKHGYAVGYFEAWNMESLLAVNDAAEAAGSPVIIGFNGTFIGNPNRHVPENIHHYGALATSVAEHSSVPTAVILNEAVSIPLLQEGLRAGFTVIMYDQEECSYSEAVKIQKRLAAEAHALGAEVEAEVGELATACTGGDVASGGKKTDPRQAAAFVEETGIDALSVSVGNVHMLEGRKAGLDLELITVLLETVPVPLVLHGGTGIEEHDLQEAIERGISKVNIGTILRRTYINSYKRYFQEHDVTSLDINEVTSTGGPLDLHALARRDVSQEVIRLMHLFGSHNKAEDVLASL